jgi:hypothetical protein
MANGTCLTVILLMLPYSVEIASPVLYKDWDSRPRIGVTARVFNILDKDEAATHTCVTCGKEGRSRKTLS